MPFLLCLLGGCGSPDARADRLEVVATLPPLAFLARELGGERLEVTSLLGPRADPEVGSLSPSAVRALWDADIVIALGGGLLAFEQRLLSGLGPGGPPVLFVREAAEGDGADGFSDRDVADDPHAWLDPDSMLEAARELVRVLSARDPEGAEVYERGLGRVVNRVRAVDRRARARLEPGRGFLLSEHPTWGVLRRRYDVRVLAIEGEEREPSARRLVEVIEKARTAGARSIVVAAGGRHRLAAVVSRELDVPIVELEPLAYDWLESLERAAALAAPAPETVDSESPHG